MISPVGLPKGLALEFPTLTAESALSWLPPVGDIDVQDTQELYASLVGQVMGFFHAYGREFPWRQTNDPYEVLVSEVMLQQTQTSRVLPKYELFLSQWPTLKDLAQAPLDQLLCAWSGLGYPRRALALRETARLSSQWGWTLPPQRDALLSLPGIGPSTSSAILCFGYRQKAVYLETNVRRVLLHCLLHGHEGVKDVQLGQLLQELLQYIDDPRAWYDALMDMGVLLRYMVPNPNKRSAHYARQSGFANSDRQVRGQLLLNFQERGSLQLGILLDALHGFDTEQVIRCLKSLENDGFVQECDGVYQIKKG